MVVLGNIMRKPSFPPACKIYKVQIIGQSLPGLTPVEMTGKPNKFGYEVKEAGSPLALDNG